MKVIILDDHKIFSEGLKQILLSSFEGIEILTFCSIKKLSKSNIDYESVNLFISDIEIPKENTFDFLKQLKQVQPDLPILIISMHNKLSVISKCIDIGVEGYILKDEVDLLSKAVNTVLLGERYLSVKVSKTYKLAQASNSLLLTKREEDVFRLLAEGNRPNKYLKFYF